MTRQEERRKHFAAKRVLGLQTPAKRLAAGEYTYRGFVIQDHGAGGSIHARMTHSAGRWSADPINPDEAPRLQFGRHYTLRAAKREIDRAYARKG